MTRLEDAVIPLLDKHADEAMGYLKLNKGTDENTDLYTRTVIWNQMSALLSEFSALAAALKETP